MCFVHVDPVVFNPRPSPRPFKKGVGKCASRHSRLISPAKLLATWVNFGHMRKKKRGLLCHTL